MIRIALAPCSPFSVTTELLQHTASLALQKGVVYNTHLPKLLDEEILSTAVRLPSVDYLEKLGCCQQYLVSAWRSLLSGRDRPTWAAGVGIAHCPGSNMRLGSGIASHGLDKAGVRWHSVDGSASMLHRTCGEVRQAAALSSIGSRRRQYDLMTPCKWRRSAGSPVSVAMILAA